MALRADQEPFSIETHYLCLIVRPYADSSELSYSASILTLVTWVPQSKLAFGHHRSVGWPSGLRPSAITILQCAALLAAGYYVRLSKNLFQEYPARCLIVGPYADSSELSYSYCMGPPHKALLSSSGPDTLEKDSRLAQPNVATSGKRSCTLLGSDGRRAGGLRPAYAAVMAEGQPSVRYPSEVS